MSFLLTALSSPPGGEAFAEGLLAAQAVIAKAHTVIGNASKVVTGHNSGSPYTAVASMHS
jgi:hypothetical protein